ncbi:hypothetical protein EVAR_15891_1 [Eumeta japonica]|uniref:Uncharacterized protein n=1 Tax=Eumeta variegata TaxID=151549 RepID=A0A4C1UE22_EUMVA|nr:hypothetical protein EVAR_15891_1 [Eumeta japonica]
MNVGIISRMWNDFHSGQTPRRRTRAVSFEPSLTRRHTSCNRVMKSCHSNTPRARVAALAHDNEVAADRIPGYTLQLGMLNKPGMKIRLKEQGDTVRKPRNFFDRYSVIWAAERGREMDDT